METKHACRYTLPVAVYAVLAAAAAHSGSVFVDSPLEEIVVTANRTAQRVFDSPASLSVINEADLDRATVPNLADLMRDIPGVQVTDAGQPGLARVRLRGEESRRTAILVNSQEVTDHHEVGTPLTLNPAMVERIEVIRGSGAVLYGSRALSGVVNFFTRKGGTEPLQATASAGYDSATGGHNAFASVFGTIDGFEYRLAAADSDHDDRSTPAGTMDNTSFDNDSLYVFAGRNLGDHRLEYIYEDYASSSQIYVEDELKTTFPLTGFYLETPRRDRTKHGVFYHWDIDSDWVDSFAANAYHQDSEREFYTLTETVWYRRDINSDTRLATDGALAQLDLQPMGDHQVILGLQYGEDDVDQNRHVATLAWAPPFTSGEDMIRDEASIETWAWFAQDQWALSDRLVVTAGLRQYRVKADLQYSDRDSLSPGSLGEDDELIGALGLVWSYSDNARLRANIAQGYVYPSLGQLATGAYAGSSFVNPDANLEPETSINYELGWRMLYRGLTLDATAFYTRSDNYIDHRACLAADNCPGTRDRIYVNIGQSRAYGLELFLGLRGAPWGLEPYANLTWMQRRNDYADFSTRDTGIPDLSGRTGVRWQGALPSLPALWADVYLRGESSSELEEPGTVRDVLADKDGWVTLNVAAGLDMGQDSQYRLSLELQNLTDKQYIASTENLYGAERSAALKLTLDW